MQRMQSSLRQSGEQPRALGSRYMRGTASPASVSFFKAWYLVALLRFCDQFPTMSRWPPFLGDNDLKM